MRRIASNALPAARFAVVSVALVVFMASCAAYEHRLVEPGEFAGAIDEQGISFALDPLEYRVYEYGSRIGLRIANTTSDPITLLGERSYLIDPQGETRSILGGTIGPHSHITMVLPPQVETVRTGPRLGVGVGVGAGYGRVGVGGYHSPWGHSPSYVRQSQPLWRWVTGAVPLQLMYELGEDRFAHELLLERERVP